MKAVLRESGGEAPTVTAGRGLLPPGHDQHASPLPALCVESLSKRFGTVEAVAGLSFDIAQGEVFGLLGPNGAGKTTTIAMLATQLRPSGGDATLFGHSVCNDPGAVRQMIGLAPQDVALYPGLTAAENLRFFGHIYGVRGARLADRVDQLLSFVELEAHRDSYVGTFSGGMQRRLNMAAALVHEPRLILLDEPTAGVDPQSRSHILELIGRLRAAGAAILYTTHYMEEAQGLCDRLGIVDQGRMVAMGTLDALMAHSNCAEIIELHGVAPGTNFALQTRTAAPGEHGGASSDTCQKRRELPRATAADHQPFPPAAASEDFAAEPRTPIS